MIWKVVDDFEDYQVSDTGLVKSMKKKNPNKILSPGVNGAGYYQVILCKDGKMYNKRVHILVAQAFISNIDNKRTIDHIDRNKLNNNLSNLQYATDIENCLNRTNNVEHQYIYYRSGKYRVILRNNGKQYYQQSFKTLEEAIKARDDNY